MTWAHWVLIFIPAAWAAFVIWIARGGFDPDEYCECRDCAVKSAQLESNYAELMVRLEPYFITRREHIWLEQPVREACELSDDEEAAWQRIRAGA